MLLLELLLCCCYSAVVLLLELLLLECCCWSVIGRILAVFAPVVGTIGKGPNLMD